MSQLLQPAPAPDPEVSGQPRHRTFSAAYKARILEEADHCTEPGQISALLRREGLYSSHLVDWRRKRASGGLDALQPKRPGRPVQTDERRELTRLQTELARVQEKLRRAELIIEVQKKVAELLGLGLLTPPNDTP
jgi:transposase-like protein